MCDFYPDGLAGAEDMPQIQLYWPVAERDRVIKIMRERLAHDLPHR